MSREPLLFTFPSCQHLVRKDLVGSTSFSVKRFSNKELQILLQTPVKGRVCRILGSISPPETNLFSLLLLSHTLKKEGAKSVVASIPYLAYSRQENDEEQKSQAASLVGALLKAAGIDELTTVDVHSSLIMKTFPIPVISLSPATLFANEIRRLKWPSYTLVAPDRGAIDRCQDVAAKLSKSQEVVWVSKARHADEVFHSDVSGRVQERVVIIDDILDTGKTLVSCCARLREHGAREMIVMVTHGLFTLEHWTKLFSLGVKKIYCTDTVPLRKELQNQSRILVLPLAKMGGALWKN